MTLLTPDDPPALFVVREGAPAPILVCCDHARPALPRALGDLGVAEADRMRHIGWDIGAEGVARALAAALDATLIGSGFSRLAIDLNRRPDDPTAIPPSSDGVPVPGNVGLAPAARQARIDALFTPYHARLDHMLSGLRARFRRPALISIHSCTPVMAGFARPWHVGVLWGRDQRIAAPLIAALARPGDLCVGDNQPYSGRDPHGYTLPRHAEPHDVPHVLLEVRQDLIETETTQRAWGLRLAAALRPILAEVAG